MCRRSKQPNPESSSHRREGSPTVRLHQKFATSVFRLPERHENTSLADIDPEFFEDLLSTSTAVVSRQGRRSTASSNNSGSQDSGSRVTWPGTSDYGVLRHVKAMGVLVAKVTSLERYGLDGRLEKRVNMMAEEGGPPGEVSLLHAVEAGILGMGSVILCSTSVSFMFSAIASVGCSEV